MNQTNFCAFSIALFIGIAGSHTWAFANSSTSITLTNPVYFVTPDGSDVVVQPGTYTIEAAEGWLLVIPGERRDALLLEATRTQHNEDLKAAKAVSQSGEADEHRIVLLLPGGKGLEAIGSVSGVRSRGVRRPPTSRTRTQQQQASRLPNQSTKSTIVQKSKTIPHPLVQPNDPLAQRIQTLEQQVSSLQTLVNTLQSQLNTMASAIQVDNAGRVTIGQVGTVTIQGSIFKIKASSIDAQAATSKFSGLVQADTLVTNSVVSSSYTPGAGNIW
jgi:hypothetical protein